MATTTLGAVVQPGTILLTLVPISEPLRAEVLVSNEDIGFVRAGQPVRLKLATYPFQRYGVVEGHVLTVAPDAGPGDASGSTPQPPTYKALIELEHQGLQSPSGSHPISVGMQLTAEIIERRRSVLEYLLSPVRRIASEAASER
jgi:HlyD family secretion protein